MKKILKVIIFCAIIFIILFIIFSIYINIMTRTNSKGNTSNNNSNSNSIVLYFSVTGNTKKIAEYIKDITNSDIYEIVPKDKYSSSDIDYNNDNSRANREQNDDKARPLINDMVDLSNYNTIYLGYPIWWGDVPKIILTLLDNYDFSNKRIILFCTSGSSGIENSVNTLKSYNKNLNIIGEKRFSGSSTKEEVEKWLKMIRNKEMIIEINNEELVVELEDNSSVDMLLDKLNNGDIDIELSDYGNFEKVGELGFNIPNDDKNITTKPGDIVLYQGNSLVLFYGSNTWSYTKLGHVINKNSDELKNILGNGSIKIKLRKGD